MGMALVGMRTMCNSKIRLMLYHQLDYQLPWQRKQTEVVVDGTWAEIEDSMAAKHAHCGS